MNLRSFIPVSSNELIFGTLLCFLTAFIIAESRWKLLYGSNAINSDQDVHLYLEDATALPELGEMLADLGVVKREEELLWAGKILGWRNFREGHYLINRGYSYEDFLSKLARGIQDPVRITIPPGRSKEQVIESIAEDMQFDSLSLANALEDTTVLQDFNLEKKDVIGRLLPNSYSIFWTSSPEKTARRIFNEFDKAITKPFSDRIEELDYSLNEIVTLASIVEWEAKSSEEQDRISGLYWNRLDSGMRLQADPTVNFAVGERRRLLYEDYRVDHPYNTYQISGLPPGPITNPSKSAIKAALFPEEHDYYYMVASPDGTHAFSETFEEHKQKSAKWRKWLQEQYRIKEQREGNSE